MIINLTISYTDQMSSIRKTKQFIDKAFKQNDIYKKSFVIKKLFDQTFNQKAYLIKIFLPIQQLYSIKFKQKLKKKKKSIFQI